jgi:hypothetical protein
VSLIVALQMIACSGISTDVGYIIRKKEVLSCRRWYKGM